MNVWKITFSWNSGFYYFSFVFFMLEEIILSFYKFELKTQK